MGLLGRRGRASLGTGCESLPSLCSSLSSAGNPTNTYKHPRRAININPLGVDSIVNAHSFILLSVKVIEPDSHSSGSDGG